HRERVPRVCDVRLSRQGRREAARVRRVRVPAGGHSPPLSPADNSRLPIALTRRSTSRDDARRFVAVSGVDASRNALSTAAEHGMRRGMRRGNEEYGETRGRCLVIVVFSPASPGLPVYWSLTTREPRLSGATGLTSRNAGGATDNW